MDLLFTAIETSELTLANYMIITAAAFMSGVIAAVAAGFRNTPSRSYVTALVLLPAIVETIIIMVNGNIGTGIAISGAFSLVRFRSVGGKAKDMVLIFLAMTCGVACAAGYIGVSLLLALIIAVAVVVTTAIPLKEDSVRQLNITIPEALNFNGAFDEVFRKYTNSYKLMRVKTSNMGSLFRLTYRIEMKNGADMKLFMDELRIRNGNLEISIMEYAEGGEEL